METVQERSTGCGFATESNEAKGIQDLHMLFKHLNCYCASFLDYGAGVSFAPLDGHVHYLYKDAGENREFCRYTGQSNNSRTALKGKIVSS